MFYIHEDSLVSERLMRLVIGCFHEIFHPPLPVLISLNKISYLHIYMSSIIFMVLLVTLNNALDRVWNFYHIQSVQTEIEI